MILEKIIFTEAFPDPITLNEMVDECWRNVRCELEFHSFGDATLGSNFEVT